jgi:protein involved in polysaccharide export with SLBB domain
VLAAGGPGPGGSVRSIKLRRNGALVTEFDLYDLLLKGDKSRDAVLQNGDVINVEPVGAEAAISGSVNVPAIYEAKPGETLADLIGYAGGFNSVADEKRLVIAGLADLDRQGSRQLTFAQAHSVPVQRGDIVRILSLAEVSRPQERQAILATVEGEVNHPGRYYLPPGSKLKDLLARAGGLTDGAYVFGADFDRASIRLQQKASFEKAISDLQLSAAVAPLSALNRGGDSGSSLARQQATTEILQRLREREPDGRLILSVNAESAALPPDLTLEDNDRLYVPPVPKTVGVFGAVFQPGTFVFKPSGRLRDYLDQAGGPRRFADRGEIFVVRANGSVVSARLSGSLARQPAVPGDVIFVPVKTTPGALANFLAISSILYQFGISGLTIAALAQ